MNKSRSTAVIMIIVLGVMAIMGVMLSLPVETYAHPAYGFTPQPPPSDDDDDDDGSVPPDKGQTPVDYVYVQLGQCDLECLEQFAALENGFDGPLLAYAATGNDSMPLLDFPAASASPPEIIVPVRLVHEGSGWIAEGELSTQQATRVSVPYPGRWDVLMIGNPRFNTAEAVDVTGTNLASLQDNGPDNPLPLGQVDANTGSPQMISCPILCVIEPEPEEAPLYLPETGHAFGSSPLAALLAFGLIFMGAGLLAFTVIRIQTRSHNAN